MLPILKRLRCSSGSLLYATLILPIIGTAAYAECRADAGWLPTTPVPSFEKPPPHPAPDCGFYKPAWQTFLFVTQNGGPKSRPIFLDFFTIDRVFKTRMSLANNQEILPLAPRGLKGSNDPATDQKRAGALDPAIINAGARQAGRNGLLVDSEGRPIFYAIHFNSTFTDFLKEKNLTTKDGIQVADPDAEFPKGAIELKSAWKIIDGPVPSDYITTRAAVPFLRVKDGVVDIDPSRPPEERSVALLSIHVVFVVEGHPEFVWATFEHVSKDGERDLAPSASALPSPANGLPNGTDGPISDKNFPLYKANTLASNAASRALPSEGLLATLFDPVQQKFLKDGSPFQTPIYRIFPGSKTFDTAEDDEVGQINSGITGLKAKFANDPRLNYRLVGAVWLDNPAKDFKAGFPLRNPDGVKTDDPGAPVAGEDGLSSMAMESFTQDSFINCFSCHDTRKIRKADGSVLVDAKKLNVSHVMSTFLKDSP